MGSDHGWGRTCAQMKWSPAAPVEFQMKSLRNEMKGTVSVKKKIEEGKSWNGEFHEREWRKENKMKGKKRVK